MYLGAGPLCDSLADDVDNFGFLDDIELLGEAVHVEAGDALHHGFEVAVLLHQVANL